MIDSMKCKCGRLMEVAEALSYGGRCEDCWLGRQGVDMRGKFVEGAQHPSGNKARGHSPKIWPKLGS